MVNQTGWQKKFCITDRRLEILTGLSSKAIADAKRILKDRFVTIKTNMLNSSATARERVGSAYVNGTLRNMKERSDSNVQNNRNEQRSSSTNLQPTTTIYEEMLRLAI